MTIFEATDLDGLMGEREALEGLLDSQRLSSLAAPEFRALSHSGSRKGVRLEAVYWSVLEDAAADFGISRNALVFKILRLASSDQSNATSMLRTFLMAYALHKQKAVNKDVFVRPD